MGALDGMLRHYFSKSEFKSPIFTLYEHSKLVMLELSCQPDESI